MVVAAFDGGAVTSYAGSLLLGAIDRAIKLVDRFTDCFTDHRRMTLDRFLPQKSTEALRPLSSPAGSEECRGWKLFIDAQASTSVLIDAEMLSWQEPSDAGLGKNGRQELGGNPFLLDSG